jgi:hypothetical protein
MDVGQRHEQAVADRLRSEGWDVHVWGQALLSEPLRKALLEQPHTVFWRWLPDMVAVRSDAIRLIDAKNEQRVDTPNYAIETAALTAHRAMERLGLGVTYVWPDFTVNWPAGLDIIKEFGAQRGQNGGSGTPFCLVRKADQFPWELAFPSARSAAA